MITVNELAQAVNVSSKTAHKWLARNPMPRQLVGGRLLLPRSTIQRYREAQERMRAKPLNAADVPSALTRALRRKVKPVGGCRVWTGTTDIYGYGTFCYTVKLSVHRAAWVLTRGPLKAGERIGPSCGNPACVEHLVKVPSKSRSKEGR